MGGISTRNFVRRTDIEGQGKEVLLHAKGMHMTNYHLHRLFHEFNKLAGDSGIDYNPFYHYDNITIIIGLVDIDEFFMFYNIPENVLLYFLFQQFELTKRGSINFDQYLITLWNLLTMQHDDMAIFMYTAFNPTELSSIDVDEVKYMIKVLYGFPKKPPEIMKNVFKKLALNKNGVITLVEFVLLSRHHKALFKPFHDLKKMIRKHVVHTRYWREQGWKRRKFNRGKSIYEVIDSFDPLFVKRNLEWLSTCRNTPPEEVAIWRAARSRQDKEVVVDVHNIHNEHLTPHQLSLKKILPPPPKFKRRFALVESTVKLYKSRYSSFGLGSENSDGDSDYEDTDYSESDNVSELSSFRYHHHHHYSSSSSSYSYF